MLLALRRHHLPARVSRDAGRYLCNAAYHRALATGLPAIFIHIPKTPDPNRPNRLPGPKRQHRWPERLAGALTEIALQLLREARLNGVERRPPLG
jgi:pyroglutamyl-peptidase